MPDATTLVLLTGVAAVLAGGGLAYWLVRRSARRQEAAAVFYHFRCPNCKRRLRFQSRQVGRKGACSHCGHPVTFPAVSQSVD
jgi:DNA-directed RNA polymerase subunit RPC12/RpoP